MNKNSNDIGNRISILRKKLNFNQSEFGEKINVTRSAISNYEKGTRNIMDRVITDICREFNVNEEWLRNGTGEMFNPTTNDKLEQLAQEYKFNSIEYKFLRSYLNLDLNKRAAVVEFLEGILDSDSSFIKNSELSATKEENIDNDIDKQVENFRQQLEDEKKGKTLSVSSKEKKESKKPKGA